MLVYIIKSILCLFVLLTFYKLCLENEKVHSFKRFFLIGSLMLSITLPLITFTYTTEVSPGNEMYAAAGSVPLSQVVAKSSMFEIFINEYLPYLLTGFYVIGALFLLYRFAKNLYKMNFQIKNNKKLSEQPYIYVLLKSKLNPHTFLNYIFLNKNDYEEQKIAREVILHEKAHVDQKHTIDILIIEFLQIIFWINPLFIWLKKLAKLNHEFLADEKVLREIKNAPRYSKILYNYAGGSHQAALSSSINYSLTKKRILMISKSFSIRKFLIRLGFFVPVLGCCLFFFNNKIAAKPLITSENNTNSKIPDNQLSEINENVIPQDNQIIEEQNYNENETSVIFQEEGVLNVKVEGEKIWLNQKLIKLEDFSAEVDAITEDWSKEAMENPWFNIDFSNSTTNFIERLNKEYRKTKLSEISGTEFLAPKPPAAAGTPPPPPPPPVRERSEQIPPPPPPPAAEHARAPHERRLMNERDERREVLRMERQSLQQERERIREERMTMEKDRKMSKRERERMERDMAREQERIEQRQKRLEERQVEIERLRSEIPAPPPPPTEKATQVITEDVRNENGFTVKTMVRKESSMSKYPKEAIYYLNDEEISYKKAMEIINEGKAKQVDIRKKSPNIDVVKIYI